MEERALSICLAFFWYGFSLVFVLFACIDRVDRPRSHGDAKPGTDIERSVGVLEKLLLTFIILVGVWGLASLLGVYNATVEYINQFMIAGSLVGLVTSNRIIGRPSLRFRRKNSKGQTSISK